jgi:MFS family permease
MASPPAVRAAPESAVEVFPSQRFRALWAALGVSQFGTAVSAVAIPLIAVLVLGVSPGQMSVLVAIEMVPAFLIRIPAATWSDSLASRVPLMSACNLLRAAVIALVPLLWWLDVLSFLALLLVIGTGSLLTGVYASLASPVLVEVVPAAHLVDANGRISATRSVADISGPALGGALLAVVAAPVVVVADAISFLVSALLLTRVKARRQLAPAGVVPTEATAGTASSHPEGRRAGDLRRLGRSLIRRSGMQVLIAVGFINGVVEPVLILFLVHDLRIRPSVIGLLFALGAVGGVAGGVAVGRLMKRRGPGGALAIGVASMLASMVALPFGTVGPSGVAAVVLLELAGSFGGTLMIATVFGTIQRAAPAGKVARVMALSMTFLQVAAVAGALVGGLLGTFAGLRTTIAVATVLMFIALVPPLLRWRAAGWKVDLAMEL